jgi:subtilisin family serine protease
VGAGGGDFTPGVFIPACALPAFGHDSIVSVCSVDSIFADCKSDTYVFEAIGTSLSAPIVSGVAALAKGKFPGMNGNRLKTRLFQTADDLGQIGIDNLFSHGRVNANKAVTVPEPSTGLLLLFGALGLAGLASMKGAA